MGLDALRGFAALYVIAFHVSAMPDPDLRVPSLLLPVVSGGGTGVVLFFVLSAFSLCLTWPRHASTHQPLRSFYLSRLFRIVPLFIALLLLMVAKDQFRQPHRYSTEEIAWNASMLFGLSPKWQPGIVMGSWTIGVEILFYMAFPLIAIYIRNVMAAAIFFGIAYLVAFLGSNAMPLGIAHLGSHTGILTQLPLFALGCLLFRFWTTITEKLLPAMQEKLGALLFASGISGLLIVLYSWTPSFLSIVTSGWYLAGISYGLILLSFLLFEWRLFVNRATSFLGTISYSLYLIHPFIIPKLYPVFHRAYEVLPSMAYFICLAICLVIVVPVSYLTYRYIESPGINMGRRLVKRLQPVRSLGSE